jgi:hypothetical protein
MDIEYCPHVFTIVLWSALPVFSAVFLGLMMVKNEKRMGQTINITVLNSGKKYYFEEHYIEDDCIDLEDEEEEEEEEEDEENDEEEEGKNL